MQVVTLTPPQPPPTRTPTQRWATTPPSPPNSRPFFRLVKRPEKLKIKKKFFR